MTSKNIFAQLNDDSDNEAPKVAVAKKTTETKVEQKPKEQPAQQGNQRGTRKPEGASSNDASTGARKENHTRGKFPRDGQKPKGVPTDHTVQDRQSGTGRPAYSRNVRKDGAGKGNIGTVKSEVRNAEEQREETTPQVVETPKVEEPEPVDNTITAAEYFKQIGATEVEEKKVERTINLEELKKEKLQIVSSRAEKVLDTGLKGQTKRKQVNNTYSVGCNTDNSELLGVKTGTVLHKYSVKQEGDKLVDVIKEKVSTEAKAEKNAEKKVHKPRKFVDNETDFPKLA